MLKILKNSVKGNKRCCCRKGCRAAGRTDGYVGVENMAARGLGSKAGTSAKVRSDRRSDRGFEGNRRTQIAVFWSTAAVGPRV